MLARALALAAVVMLFAGCAATVRKGADDTTVLRIPPAAATRLVLNISGSQRSTQAADWDDFRHGLTALFWFELYGADSTWVALAEAYERMRTNRPGAFGFATG